MCLFGYLKRKMNEIDKDDTLLHLVHNFMQFMHMHIYMYIYMYIYIYIYTPL
jgi:hypothetical protein